jgi:hypothetical protein
VLGHAVMGEQGVQEGTKHAPLKGPGVEDQRGMRCFLTSPPGGGPPGSPGSSCREVFSPRVLSLVMSFEGTMVLNAEK